MIDFHIIIPARFASSRLPGKMLREIAGKPLIQRVYERALLCGAKSVIIATDDERIQKVAENFGAEVCMTSVHHMCGTDRIAETVSQLGLDEEEIVVNIQGDEPLLPVPAVKKVVEGLIHHPDAKASTLCTPIFDNHSILDPNIVKVVVNKEGYAHYFSRAPIPWDREAKVLAKEQNYFRHVGLYAYRVDLLKKYQQWEPSPVEQIELLEQLRILWHGEKIHVSTIEEMISPGVDTELDLEKVKEFFKENFVET